MRTGKGGRGKAAFEEFRGIEPTFDALLHRVERGLSIEGGRAGPSVFCQLNVPRMPRVTVDPAMPANEMVMVIG